MRVEMAEMLDGIQRSPAEHAWIKACKGREGARRRVPCPEIGQLEHLTITAIDRCVFMGWMTAEQFAVLATHGAIGPPDRTDIAARQLWDAGITVLEAEMNRMDFPPPPPARPRDDFFWGPRGTPFIDAANAWWWTLDCLDARAENRRENSGLRIGRPCEPDDIVNALRRLELPPTHARTVMAWGRKRDKPPCGTEARRYWDEVMARLAVGLREKGIVRPAEPDEIEVVTIPLTALPLVPLPNSDPLVHLEASEQSRPRRRRVA